MSADPREPCEHDEHCYRWHHAYEHACCYCGEPGLPVPDDVCTECHVGFDECECEPSEDA